MTTPSLQDIANALGGEVRGDRACFPTPGHSQRDRGSWASIEPGAPDGVLIHSSNGGDPLAIKDELRAAGILPPLHARNDNLPWTPPKRQSAPAPDHGLRLSPGQKVVATFEYLDSNGAITYRKHRIEPGDQGRSKTFRFDSPNGATGWKFGKGDESVPYRLPDLVTAPKTAPIYMVEGEAKADKLAGWGLLATSHKDWKSFDFSGYVKGRTVYILPDNDQTGVEQAAKAKDAVEKAGGTAHLIELPGLPEGGDILDWEGSAEGLGKLILSNTAEQESLTLPALDLRALAGVEPRAKTFAIAGLVPTGEVTLFTGPGSAGKSLVAQQFATAAAAGLQCLGHATQSSPSIYLTCEDDEEQLHWRQHHICKALGISIDSLDGRLKVTSLRGELDNQLAVATDKGPLRPSLLYRKIAHTVCEMGAKQLWLDNVAHLFAGNENDRGEVTQFVNLLNRLAGETGAAIVLLGHPNKAGDSYSGSTAWLNAVRAQFTIEHDEESDLRTITNPKANYARKGASTRFAWVDWAFVLEDDLPPDRAREMTEGIAASADNQMFLNCLAEMTRQQRAVSLSINAGNYAPKVFLRMPEAKGLTRQRLEKAMDRLFRINRIERAELWTGPDRKPVFGLREGPNR